MKKLFFALTVLLAADVLAVSPFELPQMNHDAVGTLYKSADHKSGVFVVEAYFLNCPYCNDNAPNVNDLTDKYASEPRVQVLDVGIDKKPEQYETWIEKHSPNHPVLMDKDRVLIKQLGTTGYPSTYVIDCKGNVLVKTSGVWNAAKTEKIEAAIAKGLEVTCEEADGPTT